MRQFQIATVFLGFALGIGAPAAQPSHQVEVAAGISNFDQFGELRYRAHLAKWSLGADLQLRQLRTGFVAGFEVDDGQSLSASVVAERQLAKTGPMSMALRLGAGGAATFAEASMDMDRSLAIGLDVGVVARIAAGDRIAVELGVANPFFVAVDPELDLELIGNHLLVAAGYRITESLTLLARTTGSAIWRLGVLNKGTTSTPRKVPSLRSSSS